MNPFTYSRPTKWLAAAHGGKLCLLLCLLAGQQTFAQISFGGTPPSFAYHLAANIPTVTLPAVDHIMLLAEDEIEFGLASSPDSPQLGLPVAPRFAIAQDVALHLNNAGLWQELPDGTKIWRLRIASPGAYSLHLIFDHWRIPKRGLLFLYNDERNIVRGAFTATNNWQGGTNITAPIPGDAITLEYVITPPPLYSNEETAPSDFNESDNDPGELSISQVCHAYRNLFGHRDRAIDLYGDSGPCQVNINCPEAAAFADEKRAVALIISGGTRWCTGTMINRATQDATPYFLTANHCLNGNQTNWLFVFNYESPGCEDAESSTAQSVANASLIATYPFRPGSDFALLELAAPPPPDYNVYYCGWNRADEAVTHVSGISHPAGDLKKFADDFDPILNSAWPGGPFGTHWHCNFDLGGMEVGSSGSPLFDQAGHILGQLSGGYVACNTPDDSWYGKFAYDWTGGGTPETRLSDWLDPNNTGIFQLDGFYPSAPSGDQCPATVITALPFETTGSTQFASDDYSSPCFGTGSPDMIYEWTAQTAGNVIVGLCNSSFDTGLFIRMGLPCPGQTLIRCDDDGCGSGSSSSTSTFWATAGTTYFFIIDGHSGSSGSFVLTVNSTACVPAQVVIRRNGNRNYLDWSNSAGCLYYQYNVYRSSDPSVPITSTNLIGSPRTNSFVDSSLHARFVSRYFYAVTTVTP